MQEIQSQNWKMVGLGYTRSCRGHCGLGCRRTELLEESWLKQVVKLVGERYLGAGKKEARQPENNGSNPRGAYV